MVLFSSREIVSLKFFKKTCLASPAFYRESNESSLGPHFKWLDNNFKIRLKNIEELKSSLFVELREVLCDQRNCLMEGLRLSQAVCTSTSWRIRMTPVSLNCFTSFRYSGIFLHTGTAKLIG
jgi:hypothetical protein